MIKSPLRYPGGKSKAIAQISQHLPDSFTEYREPFIGGGSLFIYLKQQFPHLKIWINDLNPEVFWFWEIARVKLPDLVEGVKDLKEEFTDGKSLFKFLTSLDLEGLSFINRGIRFFVLNRITFSGTTEAGGYSEQAFQKRFTYSCIERLEKLESIVTNDIKITNLDYSQLLWSPGKDVFIFCDPPYLTAKDSKLYGKLGVFHKGFNHTDFSDIIKDCKHSWLITYDNCPQIKENFQEFYLKEWGLQYGMNNVKKSSAALGKEILINNYKLL